jgi:hypothetical protein
MEIATFASATALHSGVSLFGRVEQRIVSDALIQGSVGRILVICTYGFLD